MTVEERQRAPTPRLQVLAFLAGLGHATSNLPMWWGAVTEMEAILVMQAKAGQPAAT